MECPFCLKDNQKDARFCSHCGQNLEQTCPVCSTRHISTARFCHKCGKSFGAPLPTHDQEGERKLVSVLFADTAGFTALSEMLDPEEIAQIMQDCLSILTPEIERYGGTVTQFTGDGVMALFGAPNADEDHAKRACHAGIAIRGAILPFSNRILKRYGSEFKMRIGINSGMVVVGSVDSGYATEYTALGDTINIASRIESITPPGAVCCSSNTFRLARDFFQFEAMGSTKVKGKAHPIDLYKVLNVGQIETRLGAAMARGLTPFVGRQAELRDLTVVFDDIEAGKGRTVSIIGEAGVGKSRLLLEFRRSLHGREFGFLVGECLPFGASIAYLPLLGLLRSYFRLKEGFEPSEAEQSIRSTLSGLEHDMSFLLPPLFDVLSIPFKDEQYEMMEPRQKKDRIFQSLSRIFIKESQTKPLVISIESIMWIDRTSEEFLGYLTDLLPESRILLILLHRPGYSHSWGEKTSFTLLNIDQLPARDAPQLINSLLDAPPSRELQTLLMTTSGGNPLFIEELTNSLLEKGYVNKTNDGYVLTILSADLPIPATIHGIIAARIDHLPEPVKRTLQFAAVIGKHFSRSILELVVGKAHNLTALLQELQQLDLIYEENGQPSIEYIFKHDLVQEVAYNSLLLRRRKEIHEAVAEAIEAFNSDNIDHVQEILAYHFSKSSNSHKAYLYLKQSGAKSTRNSSLWEAFRFYKQALTLTRDKALTSQLEGLEIRLQMASAMISLGFPEDSLEILKQAETIARNLNDKKSLTSIISMIGLYYSVRGDTLRGIRYAQDCLAAAQDAGDVDLIAPIVFDLCSNYAARGEFSRVVEIAPFALSLLRETDKQDESFSRGYNIYSAILAFHAFSLGFLGEFERAASLFEEGLNIAKSLDNLYSMGLNEILYGYLFCQRADGKTAHRHFERSIQHLERGQIFVLLGLAWNGVGRARYFLGDLQDALTYAEKGLKVHTDAGVTYNLSAHFWFLALIHYELGNLAEARRKLEESLRLARKNRESYYVALSKMLWGRIEFEAGAITPQEAERVINQATRMLGRQGVQPQVAVGHLSLAEISFHMGNPKKAVSNLRKALALFSQMGMGYWTERAEKLATLAKLSL
jgi:class 3 adenylate cyclase/tetratricopeptide (TPR) repeat protein